LQTRGRRGFKIQTESDAREGFLKKDKTFLPVAEVSPGFRIAGYLNRDCNLFILNEAKLWNGLKWPNIPTFIGKRKWMRYLKNR